MDEQPVRVLRRGGGRTRKISVSVREEQYRWLLRKRGSPSNILQVALDELMRRDP